MKTVYLALLLGSIALASASSITTTPQQEVSSVGGSDLVLMEGLGEPGSGWIQMALKGSVSQGPSNGQRGPGLTTFPFSELGNTKVLLNMEHISWVYSAGQATKVTHLGGSKLVTGNGHHTSPPVHVSNLGNSDFFEVTRPNGLAQTLTLEGNSDYLFAQDSFSWMKLPVGAKVTLLKD